MLLTKTISFLTLLISILYGNFAFSQSVTLNDGFEGTPQFSVPPPNWTNCLDGNSTGDTQPGMFNNHLPASQGNTYLSLVTREVSSPGTAETVWTKPINPFRKDTCYNLQIDLTLTNSFYGGFGWIDHYFNNPCVFQLIGYNGYCPSRKGEEVLWESDVITNFEWQTFDISFMPELDTYEYIAIRPFFAPATNIKSSALLIDNLRFKITPITFEQNDGEVTIPIFATGINWYFNGENIEGEHSMNMPFLGSGTYKATFYNENGCFTIAKEDIRIDPISISIYPNPTGSKITIDSYSSTSENLQLHLYDEIGKLVFENESIQNKGLNKTVLDLSFLAPAVYYLRINKNELKNEIHKIVIAQ